VTFALHLDANPASPRNSEWENAANSQWDVARREPGGTWTTVDRPTTPAFSDNPGGYLEVFLSIPLYTTNGLEKSYEFEIYGTVAGLNVSPPDPDRQTMIKIPGTVKWITDSSGVVTTCTVSFGTVAQARRLPSSGGFPPRQVRPRVSKVFSAALESMADTPQQAELQLLNTPEPAGYSSHFNFDNRVFPSDPNPPRTPKYRALVECVLADGSRRIYGSHALREIPLNDWRVLQIDQRRVRVVRCRFRWRLSPNGQSYNSGWVHADQGNYILYAFLVWHGNNDFEVDTIVQEPLPIGAGPERSAEDGPENTDAAK